MLPFIEPATRCCIRSRPAARGGCMRSNSTAGACSFTSTASSYSSTREVGTRPHVIDSEVVACDTRGLPDFHALHFLRDGREVCVWAVDLLYLDAKDVRGLSLVERKFLLAPRGSRVDGP
jgi:hypothetical protein